MVDMSNLTVDQYIRCVDIWYRESRELPINQWNVFQRARRWIIRWQEDTDAGKTGEDPQNLTGLIRC